jgi:hypothetical protein
MRRTIRFMACDNENVLLEMSTLAYRLHAGYELSAAELDVPADTHVRIELLDDSNHLLDRRIYVVSAQDRQPPSRKTHPALESIEHIQATRSTTARMPR